jgi:putative addiction module killer protein
MFEIRVSTNYQKWESGLKDKLARATITARVVRLAAGNPGDVRSVGGGVSELRIHHGPGYRIYFTRRGSTIVLLLCGGDKSTQARDIARAKELAAEKETGE